MLPVALARPLWWLALRSLRIMTGLVLLAVALGPAGGPAATSADAHAQPAIVAATAREPAPAAARPSVVVISPGTELRSASRFAATDERGGRDASGRQPIPADRVDALTGSPLGTLGSRPSAPARRPGGDAHAWASGQRAPPQA